MKTVEEGLSRLEAIEYELSDGATTLSRSLALYEESVNVAAFCRDALNNATTTVLEIRKRLDGPGTELLPLDLGYYNDK